MSDNHHTATPIKFCCPKWGMEDLPLREIFTRIKEAGYDGIEAVVAEEEGQEVMQHAQRMHSYKPSIFSRSALASILLILSGMDLPGSSGSVYICH